MNIGFKKLEKNLCDTIKESQMKLGVAKETIRLYYNLSSLETLLNIDTPSSENPVKSIAKALSEFKEYCQPRLGCIKISHSETRYCITIPPEGVIYVDEQYHASEAFIEFLKSANKHGCTIDEILNLFHRFSKDVICEECLNEDFDYVVYFQDETIDEYRYVLKFNDIHEGHMTYHRYTKADYEALIYATSS